VQSAPCGVTGKALFRSPRFTRNICRRLSTKYIQLHHVISDIIRVTGLAIIDAIFDGERDPNKLAYEESATLFDDNLQKS
jgi:hypothetical protein